MERRLDRVERMLSSFFLRIPELKDEIDKKVRAHYGIGEEADTAEAEDAKAKSKEKDWRERGRRSKCIMMKLPQIYNI